MSESNKKSKKKIKISVNTNNPAIIYLFSSLKGLVILVLALSVISVIAMKNSDFSLFTKFIIYGLVSFGGFLSGFFANKKLRGRGIVNGAVASLIYAIIFSLLCIFAMRFNISPEILVLSLVSIVGGVVGGIISANS